LFLLFSLLYKFL
jgi:hypothetical protein